MCKVEGCGRKTAAVGLCDPHYRRWRKSGDPGGPIRGPVTTCQVQGCARPHVAKGFCTGHYGRWRRTGDPGGPLPRRRSPSGENPLQRYLPDRPGDGCWIWTGTRNGAGYGVFQRDKRQFRAHRAAYQAAYGDLPDDVYLDHLCHTRAVEAGKCEGGASCPHRACCNPAHLQRSDLVENVMLGASPAAQNARKTHCKRGHEFSPENTIWRLTPAGTMGRSCRTCTRASQREHDRRRRAARRT